MPPETSLQDQWISPSLHRVTRSMTPRSRIVHEDVPNAVRKHGVKGSASHKPGQSTGRIGRDRHRPRPQSRHVFPSIEASTFGLIQESIAHNLFFLVIQAMLWNQTSGMQARPVFFALIEKYPDPERLSKASLPELTALLRPLGLHNIRAKRCIALALCWVQNPPSPNQLYFRKGYPRQPMPPGTSLGYEIAHLPGVGPYALDSFRMFHRDEMRGFANDWLGTGASMETFEPEWKRVIPQDKELRAYLKWRWLKEGVVWDDENGHRACVAAPA